MMYTGIVYERVNTINGNKYIGQTMKPKCRDYDFYKRTRNYGGPDINNDRKLYGVDKFETNILTTVHSNDKNELRNTLHKLEELYIEVFNTKAPNGYNLTDGGAGSKGLKMSEEHKEKLRQLHIGSHPSEETRKKLSESHKGLKFGSPSVETKNKMRMKTGKRINMFDLEHNFIRDFLSIREAANIMNIDHICISRCCNNKQKTTNGYMFEFKENY